MKDKKESIDDEKNMGEEDPDSIMSFDSACLKKKKDRGSRFNEGKLRWSLVDLKCFEGLVQVLMMGAKKYSDYNWQKGLPINEVYESLMRHLVSFMDGEDNDAESGLSHLDHALCNIYFMKWFMDNKPEMDNRRKKKTVIPQ
ncbi:dATP/dGTP diphosphohydrolase domain-containing protein [Methanoculleus sp.]|jgi:hypothetical protein|uniref:dATP/dGTP diphosphohydrolase domain-containing protein n=1 Tax=Methanoculleus sp. TaxID=90427 RepID=UPI0025E5EDD8|nr:dATP/dGTP diphosphohydrolase domain-containing protein [Methanoculleus sp.]MCK9320332.1 DUF5664 domain-containing protein [Methanoculleus sp.]